jgi:regulator of protease activity HflC (stomatin/prohibitin superfamily)
MADLREIARRAMSYTAERQPGVAADADPGEGSGADRDATPTTHHAADPYRGVVIILFLAAAAGAIAALQGARRLGDKVLLDTALSLALIAGVLVGVSVAQALRRRSEVVDEAPAPTDAAVPEQIALPGLVAPPGEEAAPEPAPEPRDARLGAARRLFPDLATFKQTRNLLPTIHHVGEVIAARVRTLGPLGNIRIAVGVIGLFTALRILSQTVNAVALTRTVALVAVAACVVATAIAAVVTRYLAELDVRGLPEARGLARAARTTAWVLVAAAASVGLQYARQDTVLRGLHFAVLALDVVLCVNLLVVREVLDADGRRTFPVELGVWSALGSRPNIFASLLDAAERQFGIDLRSTWALTVARRALEPLLVSLVLLGWLSTSLTVVGVEEQGLVERLGVPSAGAPLPSGLHAHWPWPIDRVYRVPVRRVQALGVGHEGEEAGGPEDVLWSVQHAANEFTLLLGNGRDLITVDAAVQFRVVDPVAWRYHVQNPMDAVRAFAYRAVMRNTVNRTLSEALSENVGLLTQRMRAMVQDDAARLGLGIQVVGFTVGGMHPPVTVARDYEAVVSAQINKVTAVVNAQAFRNQAIPNAESAVLAGANAARAEGAASLAKAAGDAWSFRTLEAQYRAAPAEYFFRRRLETFEKVLPSRSFTILDDRFVRDGGELWVIP